MRRSMKTLVFSCVALSLAVVLAACSSGSSSSSGGSSGTSATAAATTHIHVGMVVESLSNAFSSLPWCRALRRRRRSMALRLLLLPRRVLRMILSRRTSSAAWFSAGNQCYIFDPLSSVNLVTPLAQASKQGAPLIQLSTPPDPSVDTPRGINITTFLGTDNSTAGEAAGQLMAKVSSGRLSRGDHRRCRGR